MFNPPLSHLKLFDEELCLYSDEKRKKPQVLMPDGVVAKHLVYAQPLLTVQLCVLFSVH